MKNLEKGLGSQSQVKIPWHLLYVLVIVIVFAPVGFLIGNLSQDVGATWLLTVVFPIVAYLLLIIVPGVKFYGTMRYVVVESMGTFKKIYQNRGGKKKYNVMLLLPFVNKVRKSPLPSCDGTIGKYESGSLEYAQAPLFFTHKSDMAKEVGDVQKLDLSDGMTAEVDISASLRVKNTGTDDELLDRIYDLFYVHVSPWKRIQNLYNPVLLDTLEPETSESIKKKKGADIFKEAFSSVDKSKVKRGLSEMGLEQNPIMPVSFNDFEINEELYGESRKKLYDETQKAYILKVRSEAHAESMRNYEGVSDKNRDTHEKMRTLDVLGGKNVDLTLISQDIGALPTLNVKKGETKKGEDN